MLLICLHNSLFSEGRKYWDHQDINTYNWTEIGQTFLFSSVIKVGIQVKNTKYLFNSKKQKQSLEPP